MDKTKEPGEAISDCDRDSQVDQIAEGNLEQVGKDILRDAKGTYYWIQDMSLYSNPRFLFLVMKIFFFI